MTELSADIFRDVGRNDVCPCGSGKKFKKCHEQSLKIQKEAEKKTRRVEQLIGTKTIPWHVYKLLAQINADSLPGLYWEMSHDLGDFRKKFPTMESFLMATANGDEKVAAGPTYDLRWIRVDGPDVYLLLTRGLKDPKTPNIAFEVIQLRPNEFDADRGLRTVPYGGFRIWNVTRFDRSKADHDDQDLRLADLGFEWAPAWTSPDSPALATQLATV
jgi:hypothetical protein